MPRVGIGRTLRIGLLAAAAALGLGAVAQAAALTPDQLRSDFDIARAALSEGDPGRTRYVPARTLDAAFDVARAKLSRARSDLDLYRALAPAVATMQDGHAQLQLSQASADRLYETIPTPPLVVQVLNGRAYVLRDLSGGARDWAGAEIKAIDGVPAATVVARLEAAMSMDGDGRSGRDHDASGIGFSWNFAHQFDMGPDFALTLEKDGRTATVRMAGLSGAEVSKRWKAAFPSDRVARPNGMEVRADGVAVMRIAHWDEGGDGRPGLSEQFKSWFGELDKRQVRSLVIDIRDNGGGEETLGTELLSYLLDRPFRYYDCVVLKATRFDFLAHAANDGTPYGELLPKYATPATPRCRALGAYELANRPNLGVQQAREPHFAGKVVLLINGGSFSTSAEFAALFRSHRVGPVVGATSSGGYYGNNSGITVPIVLPASGLRLDVPAVAYYLAVRKDLPPASGVKPDVPVSHSITELLAGEDKEMGVALDLTKGSSARR